MLSLLIQQLQGMEPMQAPPTGKRRPLQGTVEKYRKALEGQGWCDMNKVSELTGVTLHGLFRTVMTLADNGYLEVTHGPKGPYGRRPYRVRWK